MTRVASSNLPAIDKFAGLEYRLENGEKRYYTFDVPDVSVISLKTAKDSLAIVQGMLERGEDKALRISTWGNLKISNLKEYASALTDRISKLEQVDSSIQPATSPTTKVTLSDSTDAAKYREAGVIIRQKIDLSIAMPVLFYSREMTGVEKAELHRRNAESQAAIAESNRRLAEVVKSNSAENHEMYLPNISSLSLQMAKESLGIARVMRERQEDRGVQIHGRYGDEPISSLKGYELALKDYIAKLTEGAMIDVAARAVNRSTPATAASYQAVQDLAKA